MKVYVNYSYNSRSFSGGQAKEKAKIFCNRLLRNGISSEAYWKNILLWKCSPSTGFI